MPKQPSEDSLSFIDRVHHRAEFACGCIWTSPASPAKEVRGHADGYSWMRQGHFKNLRVESTCPEHGDPLKNQCFVDDLGRELEEYS